MKASTRYAPHIVVLAALALVPVVVHSYANVEKDDCRNPEALTPSIRAGAETARRERFMQSYFRAFRWKEGELRKRRLPTIRYAIVRSYDAKRVYYRPVHVLASDREIGERVFAWEEVNGQLLPINETSFETLGGGASDRTALHMLVYEDELIEDPYRAQVMAAPRLLLEGRRPMTLYYVEYLGGESVEEATRKRALEWLASSWVNYQALCR